MAFVGGYAFVTNSQFAVTRCTVAAADGGLSSCTNSGATFPGANAYGIGFFESSDVALYNPANASEIAGSMGFSTVVTSGATTLESLDTTVIPALPTTHQLGSPPVVYNITTTAAFTGTVSVCLVYPEASFPSAASLSLLHYQGGSWVDVTTSVDTTTHTACGQVTNFSPFVVASAAKSGSATSDPHLVGANGGCACASMCRSWVYIYMCVCARPKIEFYIQRRILRAPLRLLPLHPPIIQHTHTTNRRPLRF